MIVRFKSDMQPAAIRDVQLSDALDLGHRDEMPAAKAAHLALDAALFMGALLPGLAERGREQVVRAQRDEPV